MNERSYVAITAALSLQRNSQGSHAEGAEFQALLD
jgi:hypothetical protein